MVTGYMIVQVVSRCVPHLRSVNITRVPLSLSCPPNGSGIPFRVGQE